MATVRYLCSAATIWPIHGNADRAVAAVGEAGFDGIEIVLHPDLPVQAIGDAARAAGLLRGAVCHLRETVDAAPLFAAAAAFGAAYFVAQVDGYWRSDDWIAERVGTLQAQAGAVGLSVFLETHRGRCTQDLRRTLSLCERMPDLRLCGDFGHYVLAGELRAPWPDETRRALNTLAGRCGVIHARISGGERSLDLLDHCTREQIDEYLDLWRAVVRASVAPELFVTTELLDFGHQCRDEMGRPIGDLWAETLRLLGELKTALSPVMQAPPLHRASAAALADPARSSRT